MITKLSTNIPPNSRFRLYMNRYSQKKGLGLNLLLDIARVDSEAIESILSDLSPLMDTDSLQTIYNAVGRKYEAPTPILQSQSLL